LKKKIETIDEDKKKKDIRDQKVRAAQFQKVMGKSAASIKEEEEKINGLIIVRAYYGKLDSLPNFAGIIDRVLKEEFVPYYPENPKILQVTTPLQYFVENSSLNLQIQDSKGSLMGFYDPCPDEDKYLEIYYRMGGILYHTIISDMMEISLPSKDVNKE